MDGWMEAGLYEIERKKNHNPTDTKEREKLNGWWVSGCDVRCGKWMWNGKEEAIEVGEYLKGGNW